MELKNRSELVFLYDIRDANPNGDPDENKPRIDEETGINIVTDVRLKRTIRDYLHKFKGYDGSAEKDIFIREIEYEPGKIQDAKMRAKDFVNLAGDESQREKEIITKFKNQEKISKNDIKIIKGNIGKNLLKRAIDVRLFGATVPLEFKKNEIEEKIRESIKTSLTFIGSVQFRFGRSLHKVETNYIKGTGAFASEAGKEQKTFREEYILPYSLISFYGVINENAAKATELREEDINELMDGIWNGTKNLITRSKFGQMPRFLMRVVYNEGNYHIGDLDKKIRLLDSEGKEVDEDGKDGKEIRYISDVKLDITELVKTLKAKKDRIEKIQIEMNDDVVFKVNQVETKGKSLVEELGEIEELKGKVEMLDLEK